jgi:hypothetical protein
MQLSIPDFIDSFFALNAVGFENFLSGELVFVYTIVIDQIYVLVLVLTTSNNYLFPKC